MEDTLNLYGDKLKPTISNLGADIASQRADDLDNMAIARVRSLSMRARALDVGSAGGGQAIRMAAAGAYVAALDIDDYADIIYSAARKAGLTDRCSFTQADIVGLDVAAIFGKFDVIMCQRMIHYMRFDSAASIVKNLKDALNPEGRLYISASGLHSELGNGYQAAGTPVAKRFAPLADEMVSKHAIQGPVCLHSLADLATLLETAGMRVEKIFASPFGNVKAIASK